MLNIHLENHFHMISRRRWTQFNERHLVIF